MRNITGRLTIPLLVVAPLHAQSSFPIQDRRIDFASDTHRNNLTPGQTKTVPKSSIGVGSQGREKNPEQAGWERQDQAQQFAGNLWSSGSGGDWSDFMSGKRKNPSGGRGTIEIDGAVQMNAAKPEMAKISEQTTGWGRMAAAHANAAGFEELQLDQASENDQIGMMGRMGNRLSSFFGRV